MLKKNAVIKKFADHILCLENKLKGPEEKKAELETEIQN